MLTIDLKELYLKQKELDEEIACIHHVTYKSTHHKRSLALLVEVGELANATRCFKYWSNKKSEPLVKVLDEFADGLHFFLSLGIDIGVSSYIVGYDDYHLDASEHFNLVYKLISNFIESGKEKDYKEAFKAFLSLIYPLNIDIEQVIVAYYLKLKENHNRQANNY